jgi:hypothetical protein
LPAEAKHLWTKAKKNFRLGIFTHPYRKLPLEKAVAQIKADGFRSVVTDFCFADVRFNAAQPDWDALKKVRDCLDRNGLAVAGLYGYYNVVAPDLTLRRKGRERMEFITPNRPGRTRRRTPARKPISNAGGRSRASCAWPRSRVRS